jgi:site-specific DNA-methyltransferase (adenine-specific)
MMAYLTHMAVRVVELHRVLKPTGSIYLHCDPTASHYLKVLMDAVFGFTNYQNEIIWKRSTSHGNVGRNYGSLTDVVFFYSRTADYTWVQQYAPLTEEYVAAKFTNRDADGRRWQSVSLRNPGVRPNLQFPFAASTPKWVGGGAGTITAVRQGEPTTFSFEDGWPTPCEAVS